MHYVHYKTGKILLVKNGWHAVKGNKRIVLITGKIINMPNL